MTSFNDLDYADDAAFLASDPTRWNSVLERFREEAATVGLRPSWGKTKVCHVGLGGPPMNLNIHGEVVESVDSFIYLGSEINSSGYCTPDIKRRIRIASSTMSQLDRVWKQSRLSLDTKLRIYNSCIVSTALYGAECWTLLKKDADMIRSFHMQCQRRILKVRWFDRITNAEISARTGLEDITTTVVQRRHSLFGHVCRMDPQAPVHKALYVAVQSSASLPTSWKKPRGRPRHSWLK